MNKLTELEVIEIIRESSIKFDVNYEKLDKYEHSHSKMRFVCKDHGIFRKSISEIKKAFLCPECSRHKKDTIRKKKHSDNYSKVLKKKSLVLREDFVCNKRLLHQCLLCNKEFRSLKRTIVSGAGCPHCEGRVIPKTRKRYTIEEFLLEFKHTRPELTVKQSSFNGISKKATFKCVSHGVFVQSAGAALRRGCPSCSKERAWAKTLLDKSVWEDRIKKIHKDKIRLLGKYSGTNKNKRYRFKCYICFNTWKSQLPSVAIKGTGCPHCVNQQKSKAGFRVKTYTLDDIVFRVQGYEFQGIVWLIKHKNLQASDIFVESTSKVPVIPYRFGKRTKNYYPDMYIPKLNRIVEVKSNYTLGLSNSSKSSLKNWIRNQIKAKATIAKGYNFTMLVMTESGTRIKLPKLWYNMKAKDVIFHLAYYNGYQSSGKDVRHALKDEEQSKLLDIVAHEKDISLKQKSS